MTFGKGHSEQTGERGFKSWKRAVNVRFGVSAARSSLPKRLTDVPQDLNDPRTELWNKMKKIYYQARGWDKSGIPTCRT